MGEVVVVVVGFLSFFVEDLFWFKDSMGSVNGSVILGLFQCRISLWGSLWEGVLLAWHGQEAKTSRKRKNSRKDTHTSYREYP